jgi:phage terminase small subunit
MKKMKTKKTANNCIELCDNSKGARTQATDQERKLTLKQLKFVAEYLVDLNATKAAIRAGYSRRTASSIGEENLRKPEIQKEIEKRMDDILEDRAVMTLRVIRELECIAFSDISHYVEFDNGETRLKPLQDMDTRALASVVMDENVIRKGNDIVKTDNKLRVKMHDKIKALELLARYLGILNEKNDTPGEVKIKLVKGTENW